MNRMLLLAWLVPAVAEAPPRDTGLPETDPLPAVTKSTWTLSRAPIETYGYGSGVGLLCGGQCRYRQDLTIDWGHSGGLWFERVSREQIRKVINDHRHTIRYCYEHALTTNPELAGRVALRFTIGESGAVTESNVVETELGDEVAACVAGRVALMPFPAPGPGALVVVNYPFVFQPGT